MQEPRPGYRAVRMRQARPARACPVPRPTRVMPQFTYFIKSPIALGLSGSQEPLLVRILARAGLEDGVRCQTGRYASGGRLASWRRPSKHALQR